MSRQVTPAPLSRRPTVSVVIPNYNYGAYLPDAVGSVLGQEGVQVEVIIVDDCSTDGSLDVARRLASADDRVVLVEHERNMRHIATYNDGLERMSGEYSVLLSADDALPAGALSRAVTLMEAEPSIGLVYGHPEEFSSEEPPSVREPRSWPGAQTSWTAWSGHEWVARMCRRGRNMLRSPEAVMRTSVFREIGGRYDDTLPHSADMYLWLRLAAHADVGRVNGMKQAYYRVHDANMHSTWFGGLLDDLEARRTTFRRFFEVDGERLANRDALEHAARKGLAREAYTELAYLPVSARWQEQTRSLLEYARDVDPGGRARRAYYRLAARTRLGTLAFRVDKHRKWRRDQRELRTGV